MRHSALRFLPALFRKSFPVQFTVFLTRKCNAKCSFCFYLSREPRPEPSHDELTLEELSRVSEHAGSLLWLAFSGGEFFLRPDLVEITSAFYRNTRPSVLLLPTNGIATNLILEKVEAITRHCTRTTVVVKVSVDGSEGLHDALRGVNGARRQALETCRGLAELGRHYRNLEVGVNSVFCRSNQDELDGLMEEVRQMEGITTHTVSMIRGEVGDSALCDVDWNRYEKVANRLAEDLRKSGERRYRFYGARLKAAQDILQRKTIRNTVQSRSAQGPCFAGKLTLVLTETGDLFPCESFSRKIGNVRVDGYDIRRVLARKEVRKTIDSINAAGCWCTHECYHMMNILFNPRRLPDLVREYWTLPGPLQPRSPSRRGSARRRSTVKATG